MSTTAPSQDESLRLIKDRALNLLSRREYSRLELRQRLSRKFDKRLVDTVLDELKANEWQCDQRFAFSFIRASIYKSDGPIKIRYHLNQKGVAASVVDSAMIECGESIDWSELAIDLRRRRFGLQSPHTKDDWAKQARFLQGKGFDMDCIEQSMGAIDIE